MNVPGLSAFVLGMTRVAEDGEEGCAASVFLRILFKYIQLNSRIPGANT